jgi:hypothetical protein
VDVLIVAIEAQAAAAGIKVEVVRKDPPGVVQFDPAQRG